MVLFRALLLLMLIVLAVYTGVVVVEYGLILLNVFFRDIAALGWPGQFNLDFMMMLMLSGLWVAWRHRFRPLGLLLGVVAFFGEAGFLTIYLLIMTAQAKGDMVEVLVGDRRVTS